MRRTLIVIALVAGAHSALAQGLNGYGWNSGYIVKPLPDGGAYLLGFDATPFAYWSATADPKGNMYGFDGHGNYWTYDRRTNTYINHHTGAVCRGRICW
jgi:hypothetical protein